MHAHLVHICLSRHLKLLQKGIKKTSEKVSKRHKTIETRQKVSKGYQKEFTGKVLNGLYYKGTKRVYKRYSKGIERRSQKRYQKDYATKIMKRCQKGI